MDATKTRSSSIPMSSTSEWDTSNLDVNAPEDISAVLLGDGKWHSCSNVRLLNYAISERHSPIKPTRYYNYLRFTDTSDKKEYNVPFNAVMGFQTK